MSAYILPRDYALARGRRALQTNIRGIIEHAAMSFVRHHVAAHTRTDRAYKTSRYRDKAPLVTRRLRNATLLIAVDRKCERINKRAAYSSYARAVRLTRAITYFSMTRNYSDYPPRSRAP